VLRPARYAPRSLLTLLALTCVPALQPALAAPGKPLGAPPATPAAPAVLPACTNAQLTGHGPDGPELAAHRKNPVPSLHYPFGTQPGGSWGLFLTLKVSETGQVVCYRMKDQYGKELPLNDQRRAVLEKIKAWRYLPFVQDGHPVATVLVEHINEEEQPQSHVPTPDGPLESLHLRLDRGLCSGVCAVYTVDVSGDGQVVYRGNDYVDVQGEHRYLVPVEQVAKLVQKLKTDDLWSLRPQYVSTIADAPRFILTMRIGSGQRQLVDYVGEEAGMPAAVTDFENEIDRVAHTEMWITLTRPGLEQLKKEGFDFHSKAGGELLARAVTGAREEGVLVELVNLGAPLGTLLDPDDRLESERSLTVLDQALLNGQGALADAMLSHGAMRGAGGKVDPHRLDVAFRAAIVGGRLALVQKIWDAGEGRRPSLTYTPAPERGGQAGRALPVTLLLQPEHSGEHPWEGLGIVKFLEAQGCDLKAANIEGITLLHVAATAPDLALIRYLLSKGLKDNPAPNGASVLASAQDEQTALLLLTSGTSHPPVGEAGKQYRDYIDAQHWNRVAAWLKAHAEQ